MHVCVFVLFVSMYEYMRVCTCVSMYVCSHVRTYMCMPQAHVSVHVHSLCMFVQCMHVRVHVNVLLYVCMFVRL